MADGHHLLETGRVHFSESGEQSGLNPTNTQGDQALASMVDDLNSLQMKTPLLQFETGSNIREGLGPADAANPRELSSMPDWHGDTQENIGKSLPSEIRNAYSMGDFQDSDIEDSDYDELEEQVAGEGSIERISSREYGVAEERLSDPKAYFRILETLKEQVLARSMLRFYCLNVSIPPYQCFAAIGSSMRTIFLPLLILYTTMA